MDEEQRSDGVRSPEQVTSVPARLQTAIAAIEQDTRLDALMEPLGRAAAPVSHGTAGSFWRGDWLGHALHPLMTDFPLGCWASAGLLDLLGGRGSRRSAQRLIGLGLLGLPPTMAAGLSEWETLRDPRARRVAVVHAAGNGVVGLLYFKSWRARRRGRHARGVAYALLGGAGAWATGYLGGHLSFARGAGTGERGMDLGGEQAGPTERHEELSGGVHVAGV